MKLPTRLLAAMLLTIASFVIGFSAQPTSAQSISIKEKLPDGEYIVVVEGIEQRTITSVHAAQIKERLGELDKLQRAQPLYEQEISQLRLAVDLAKKDAQLATTQTSYERERAEKFRAMFNGEQALRLQAEKLMARGRVTKFFDNPYVQIGVKIAQPLVQTLLTARRE